MNNKEISNLYDAKTAMEIMSVVGSREGTICAICVHRKKCLHLIEPSFYTLTSCEEYSLDDEDPVWVVQTVIDSLQ